MAATGYTPISLYYSTTASAVPTAGNLANGELALNIADMKLYAKNSAGAVTLLASNASTTGVDSLSFGSTGLTPSTATTGAITVAGTLNVANGGTGKTSYTANGVLYASGTGTLANGSALQFDGTNLGLGVTPSAWGSYYKAIESTAASEFAITSQVNGIEVGRGYYKINAGFASLYTTGQAPSRYAQSGTGVHSWSVAASGTAGNTISFTQAMTLLASGNLTVGYTDANILGGGTARIGAYNYNTNSTLAAVGGNYTVANYGQLYLTGGYGDGGTRVSGYFIRSQASGGGGNVNNDLLFVAQTSNGGSESERARINSSGAWSFGSSGTNTGTSGQVLTSQGSGSAPTWAAAGGGTTMLFAAFSSTGETVFAGGF